MAAWGLTIVKSMPYRGAREEWSNQYHFTGSPPANDTDWLTFVDLVIAVEAAVLDQYVTIDRLYGYENTDNDSVYVLDLRAVSSEVPGTYSGDPNNRESGDTAYWVRWKTDHTNSNGKQVYGRKYFHPGFCAHVAGQNDALAGDLNTLAAAYGDAMVTGFGDGRTIADPAGHAMTNPVVSTYVTTRTLRRRGRRP